MPLNLPASRNTTYSPASPVLSVDLNDIQDQMIRFRNAAFEDPVSMRFAGGYGSGTFVLNTTAVSGEHGYWLLNYLQAVFFPCNGIREGDEIVAICLRGRTDLSSADGELETRCWRKPTVGNAAPIQIGSTIITAANSSAPGDLTALGAGTFVLATPVKVSQTDQIYFTVQNTAGNSAHVQHVGLRFTHPPL